MSRRMDECSTVNALDAFGSTASRKELRVLFQKESAGSDDPGETSAHETCNHQSSNF